MIAGTTKPIFKMQHDLWDFYFSLDEETMLQNEPENQKSNFKVDKSNGMTSLENFFGHKLNAFASELSINK